MFLGLRTIIYPAPGLDASKAWFTRLLGIEPYFEERSYVGFQVAGYELALDPNSPLDAGPVTYWGVRDCDDGLAWLVGAGAVVREPVRDVGDSIRVATVIEPAGNVIGIIENPHFELPGGPMPAGPGR
ncbi:MAG: VOC family protein [Solirubrobacterales bacterium]|nr:VOC family protein [Solirubrobacterales bacterium]